MRALILLALPFSVWGQTTAVSEVAEPATPISTEAHMARFVVTAPEPRVALPVEFLVRAAMGRNLDLLVSLADSSRARHDDKAARAVFDPVFLSNFEQSKSDTRLVVSPGTVPAPVTVKSRSISVGVSKKTTFGGSVDITALTTRGETTPVFPSHATGVTLTLTQPLLKGRGRVAAYSAARIAAIGGKEALATAQRVLEKTIAAVENAYWLLRQREEDEEATARSLKVAMEILRRNKKLNRLELISDHDVLTAEGGAATRRVAHIGAVRARRDAADDLIFLAYGEETRAKLEEKGFAVRTSVDSGRTLPRILSLSRATQRALDTRADLRASRWVLEQSDLNLAAAKNGILPQLDFTGSLGRGGSDQTGQGGAFRDSLDGVASNRDRQWSLGGLFRIPLGNRPARAKYDSALVSRQRQRLLLVVAENAVRLEVRKAIRGLESEIEHFSVAKMAADISRRQFDQERARMKLGLVDSFRVLQAEELATQAHRTFDAVKFSLATAVTDYKLALGTIAKEYDTNLISR